MLGIHEKSIVNHEPKARDFFFLIQAFRVGYHSQVDYHASKPIESVVYCFYKITLSKTMSLPAQ